MRTFIVANPKAGGGQVEKEWDHIERLLRTQIEEIDFAFTEGPEHATLLTREALRAGWEMVVGVGGDGTFNEVVNGFFEKPDVERAFSLQDGWIRRADSSAPRVSEDAVMGFLPMGTGGDFRRTVGLMGDLKENIDRLGGDHTRPCDVGQITHVDHDGKLSSRFFLNIASAGFGGRVDELVNKGWKGLGGGLAFRVGSTRAWLTWTNKPVEILLDEVHELRGDFFNIVVANGEFFGGGMWVAPGAEIDDGEFQVVLFADLTKWQSAMLMAKIYSGAHLEMENVSRQRASQVAVRPLEDDRILLDVDGEQPGRLPALFNLHHHAIRLKI